MLPQEMAYGWQQVTVLPLARDVLTVAAASRVWLWRGNSSTCVILCMLRICDSSCQHITRDCLGAFSSSLHAFARLRWQPQEVCSLVFQPEDWVLDVVSAPVANSGDSIRDPFVFWKCVMMVWCFSALAAQGFVMLLPLPGTLVTWRDIWTRALCMLLIQPPQSVGCGLHARCGGNKSIATTYSV
jgi:hypothetical protein